MSNPSKNLEKQGSEDQSTLRELAIAEAQAWGLTAREAEVWMLRRCRCTYLEMANQLHISLNTVMKHMKNIYCKKIEAGL